MKSKETKKQEKKEKSRFNPERFTMSADNRINTDPLGSWTGVPDDPYDKPIQDADDL